MSVFTIAAVHGGAAGVVDVELAGGGWTATGGGGLVVFTGGTTIVSGGSGAVVVVEVGVTVEVAVVGAAVVEVGGGGIGFGAGTSPPDFDWLQATRPASRSPSERTEILCLISNQGRGARGARRREVPKGGEKDGVTGKPSVNS